MPETPEQKARREIDRNLAAAGWLVQSRQELDITAGRGIAVREFQMKSGFGFADYLLYLDRKAVGAVEAKPEGTLTGVEAQSAKYAAGLPDNLPAHKRPLPFLFESNGSVTYFTNGLDPTPRSRQLFSFPQPETVWELLAQPAQLRARLKQLPSLDESRLWRVQAQAIRNLEASFGRGDQRALIQMATGSDKTFTAVNVAYREELRERYQTWLKDRDASKAFTAEQREWLDRMAEHIATSLAIAPEDFEDGWFGQHGSLGRAHALFADKLQPLMAELNERLAA